MNAGQTHCTSIAVKAGAQAVFAFMADPEQLRRWSFGTWQTEISGDGLVAGTSLLDGSRIYLRIDADAARLSVDYRLGADPARLVPRINVRVVPGADIGLGDGACVLTFTAWRAAAMDDERWRRLTASHEFEVVLIKNLFESGGN